MPKSSPSTAKRKAAMLDSLTRSMGVIAQAVKETGICRATHYKWMKQDEDYKAKVDEIFETLLDYAEHQLHSLIQKKNPAAIFFFLKSRGKARGYGFQKEEEFEAPDEEVVKIVLPDNQRMKQISFDMDKPKKKA